MVQDNTWLPLAAAGGHFSSVEDLAWEPAAGNYLLTVSGDQTTRLHAPWVSEAGTDSVVSCTSTVDFSAISANVKFQFHVFDFMCKVYFSR